MPRSKSWNVNIVNQTLIYWCKLQGTVKNSRKNPFARFKSRQKKCIVSMFLPEITKAIFPIGKGKLFLHITKESIIGHAIAARSSLSNTYSPANKNANYSYDWNVLLYAGILMI